jgi:hypothetical protein
MIACVIYLFGPRLSGKCALVFGRYGVGPRTFSLISSSVSVCVWFCAARDRPSCSCSAIVLVHVHQLSDFIFYFYLHFVSISISFLCADNDTCYSLQSTDAISFFGFRF